MTSVNLPMPGNLWNLHFGLVNDKRIKPACHISEVLPSPGPEYRVPSGRRNRYGAVSDEPVTEFVLRVRRRRCQHDSHETANESGRHGPLTVLPGQGFARHYGY